MRESLKTIDERVTLRWATQRLPKPWHGILQFYTRLGDGYVWALLLVYLFLTRSQGEIWSVVKQGFLAGGISLFLYLVIKYLVRRPRPFVALPQIRPEVPPLDEFSFPSGHTMNNLSAGLAVFYALPSVGWVVVAMPITWGVLRVYFGVHWLSDILAGMALGLLSFGLSQYAWQILHFVT